MAEEEKVVKVEAKDEPKPEKVSLAKKKSAVINKVLGTDIDWTGLNECDLKALHDIVNDDRRLRKLAIRIIRTRIRGLGSHAKKEAKGIVRDIITESGVGDWALKQLAGDDEDGVDDTE